MHLVSFMVAMTSEEYQAAKKRGEALMRGPRAIEAHYDAGRNRIVVRLTTGVEIGVPPHVAEGLAQAAAPQIGDLIPSCLEAEA